MFTFSYIHLNLKDNPGYLLYLCIDLYIDYTVIWWEVCFAIVGAVRIAVFVYKAIIHFFLKINLSWKKEEELN